MSFLTSGLKDSCRGKAKENVAKTAEANMSFFTCTDNEKSERVHKFECEREQ